MNTTQVLKWLRSQIIGIIITIVVLLVASAYAGPYSPSAFGYAKYDVSCFSDSTGHAICVRVDTTTGDSSCKYDANIADYWGGWINCHSVSADPSTRNPW